MAAVLPSSRSVQAPFLSDGRERFTPAAGALSARERTRPWQHGLFPSARLSGDERVDVRARVDRARLLCATAGEATRNLRMKPPRADIEWPSLPTAPAAGGAARTWPSGCP